jgi:branched-chain amino acid transport system permease protein
MNYWFHIVNIGLIITVLGFSLNLLIGYTRLVSMAHGAFYGVGAYTAAIGAIHLGIPFPLTMVFAIALTGIFATLVAWPALRVRHEYLILLTLAIQFVFTGVLLAWTDVTGGASGMSGIPRPEAFGRRLVSPPDFTVWLVLLAAVAFAVAYWAGESPFGRVLRSIREDETATLAMGKNVTYHKVAVFGVSGLLAGAAGSAFAHYQAFVSPRSFDLNESIFLIGVIVVGGAGNLVGTLIGAAVLASIPEFLRFLDLGRETVGVAQKFLFGALLVAFMLFRPEGIVPEGARLRRRGRDSTRPSGLVPDGEPREERPSGDTGRTAPPTVASATVREDLVPETTRGARPSDERDPADLSGVLEARALCKRFGGVTAANDLSMVLRPDRVTALVGPNGAGKTTVFNLLTGFITPDSGTVLLDGEPLDGLSPWRRARRGVVRTFQDVRLFSGLSVLDNVLVAIPEQPGETLSSLYGQPATVRRRSTENVDRALEHLELVGLRDRAWESTASLGFGEQKLVSLARLAASEGEVLLLDEPASGVDRQWVEAILAFIRQVSAEGKTVCVVEHNLDVVRAVADHIYFMDTGTVIAEGPPEQLMADKELTSIYFGSNQ